MVGQPAVKTVWSKLLVTFALVFFSAVMAISYASFGWNGVAAVVAFLLFFGLLGAIWQ